MFTILVVILTWLVMKKAELSGDIGCILITAMLMDFAVIIAIIGVWAGWW